MYTRENCITSLAKLRAKLSSGIVCVSCAKSLSRFSPAIAAFHDNFANRAYFQRELSRYRCGAARRGGTLREFQFQHEQLDVVSLCFSRVYRFANPRYTCSFPAGFGEQIKNRPERDPTNRSRNWASRGNLRRRCCF